MRTKRLSGVLCLIAMVCASVTGVMAATKAEPVVLTEDGKKLTAEYAEMLTELRAEIAKSLPAIDPKKGASFMEAYAAVGTARGGQWRDKAKYAATLKPVAEAQSNALVIARSIFADIDTFLTGDRLDEKLVKCAVLSDATPRGLAEFGQQGKKEEKLIKELLSNTALMKRMLEAGGALGGNYGQAMHIYTDILKASKRACKPGILQRFALGTSLELAVPIVERSRTNMTDMERKNVDPVKRYLHYEQAFGDGELDPEFKTLTAWECRFVSDCECPNAELAWGREMLRTYRPDHIFTDDYKWRYSKTVKTDVKYGGKNPSIPELGFFQDILNTGGVCGKRAFFGRFILKANGIPSFGMTQRGHAALGHWTPEGWTMNFGAHWHWGWWEKRGHVYSGMAFLLETQAREYPQDYIKALRAEWAGDAMGEEKVNGRKLGTGGLWNALGLYEKRAIVAEAKPIEVELAGEDLAEANESTKAEKVMKAEIAPADKQIVTGRDGVITIPAVACSSPTDNTAKIVFMKSFSGGMQLHYNRLGNPEAFEYTLEIPQAGSYRLISQVATVNKDQQLTLALNGSGSRTEIALPYTIGLWQETEPVEISLAKGRNVMTFTRNDPNYGVTIKQMKLVPVDSNKHQNKKGTTR